MMTSSIHSITFDCARADYVAEFWAATLGYTVQEGADDEDAVIVHPEQLGPRLLFVKVPEGKTVKNRVHLDIKPDSSMEVETARLIALGARKIRVFHEEKGMWTVMQDPEGNEFCVERGPLDVAGPAELAR